MPARSRAAPPLGDADALRDHLKDALDHWFSGTRGWSPAIDVVRRPGELLVPADVPGSKSQDLRTAVEGAALTIAGARDDLDAGKGRATSAGSASLVPLVDPARIEAKLEDDLLELTVPPSGRVRPGAGPDQTERMSDSPNGTKASEEREEDARRTRPSPDRRRRWRRPHRVDAARPPGGGPPPGQRAAGYLGLPKAHVLNQRAMEVLEDCGVADAIAERSTPASQMAATAYYAGFAGAGSGRAADRPAGVLGGRRRERDLACGEPVAPAQPPADPARADPEGRRGAALAGPDPLQPRAARARAGRGRRARVVRDNGTGEEYRGALRVPARRGRRAACAPARSAWTYEGLGVVTETATLHVTADFSRWARDPDVLIRWIASPQAGDADRHGPDGARALGTRLGGVGHPPELPGGRPRAQSDEQVEADVQGGDRPVDRR